MRKRKMASGIGCCSSKFMSFVVIIILPQAVCTRYGLTVGAAMTPLVRVLLLLFFPISYPVSKVRQIPDSEYTIRTSFLASELYSVQRQVTETAYMILSFRRKLRLLNRSSTLSCQSLSANVFLCQEGILGETDEHVNIDPQQDECSLSHFRSVYKR
ncbi:hypothetical protein NC651_007314 [Populus alba x Populus x berolinensis]|nr:hypothetical protein NC651_007314 [Populus alba x Populus x berolinensis]